MLSRQQAGLRRSGFGIADMLQLSLQVFPRAQRNASVLWQASGKVSFANCSLGCCCRKGSRWHAVHASPTAIWGMSRT